MPETDSSAGSSRVLGPIRIVGTSLARQLLGFVLAFVGLQILAWALRSGSVGSGVAHAAIGTFVALNGLYLGGVRPR
ncbi:MULTISPECIES: hypothetical protein [Halorussus]|uniref:hypothetical protein n=1 Tax=Halorussus TaxID=1070314 RepID=UPI000E213D05|nr:MULTISPECIES: hypothetical protein [Halorussus]NHN61512.1 hypothetical protein [Halorussus sp. JP-T4]